MTTAGAMRRGRFAAVPETDYPFHTVGYVLWRCACGCDTGGFYALIGDRVTKAPACGCCNRPFDLATLRRPEGHG